MSENGNEKKGQQTGIIVIVVLAILTAGEFVAASALNGSLTVLGIIALVKAGLIMQYFMHMSRALNPEKGEG